jgi:hypothetical protein
VQGYLIVVFEGELKIGEVSIGKNEVVDGDLHKSIEVVSDTMVALRISKSDFEAIVNNQYAVKRLERFRFL